MGVLIGAVVLIIIIALALSGKLRVLVKGFFNLFVEDLAKTPEGAEAIYTEAINKAQNEYVKANNTLQKVAGQLDTAKTKLIKYENELKKCEQKCEDFAKLGKFDKVELFSSQRQEIIDSIENTKPVINELIPILEEAKEINNHYEEQIKTLKRDKVRIVEELKRNEQLKEMYDDMDELKKSDHVDKLLGSIKDGAKEKRENAVGARMVHENKISTKINRANREAKSLQNDSYVESLKNKYKK